jgi:hypothetical protein
LFFGAIKRNLHTEADAKNRRAGGECITQYDIEARFAHAGHATACRAHARKYDPLSSRYASRISTDICRHANLSASALHTAKVSCLVVDYYGH